jgi:membrane associated rhomboid family serine protease
MVTSLLVALGAGAYVSQMVITIMLHDADGRGMLWRWLALDRAGLFGGEYWKVLTYGFLHDTNPLHLLINMPLLFLAGREVEPIVGWRHFLAIYVLGGIVGGIAHGLSMPAVPLIGVSASVVAVLVAFCTILPELEVRDSLFSVIPVRFRARHLAIAVALTCGVLWWSGTLLAIGPVAMLAAGVFAWIYVKQLGFGNPLALQRYIFRKRERAARLERMSPEQFITTQIDPILEKISREGVHRLTRAERKILTQGRDKIAQKAGREE